jgi:hypothetical protein
MHGEPARPELRLDQGVRTMSGEEKPVARAELDLLPLDEELGPTLDQEDPLVVIQVEKDGLRQESAQDLLDGQAGPLNQTLDALTRPGCARRRLKPTAKK